MSELFCQPRAGPRTYLSSHEHRVLRLGVGGQAPVLLLIHDGRLFVAGVPGVLVVSNSAAINKVAPQ